MAQRKTGERNMKEPYKNKLAITIVSAIYDVLVLASCFALFGLVFVVAVNYGLYTKEYWAIFIPTIILIFHTIAVKVSREDMFEKEKQE